MQPIKEKYVPLWNILGMILWYKIGYYKTIKCLLADLNFSIYYYKCKSIFKEKIKSLSNKLILGGIGIGSEKLA
ncbi:hypothetical protein JBW_03150 [Pelosinus fermentans JBW45]|uniref:Uncharacterized protein n=1 Tax=Pelosinus fermentans JBW45 TaxID=1192197 RepID=I9NPF1_9FIRM|nr:hypothetical protein JBW_03150 [Pelosinus fermentans JBW45]